MTHELLMRAIYSLEGTLNILGYKVECPFIAPNRSSQVYQSPDNLGIYYKILEGDEEADKFPDIFKSNGFTFQKHEVIPAEYDDLIGWYPPSVVYLVTPNTLLK